MHDIWNPWHGCVKYSEGCQNCYMFYLDKIHQNDGSKIYKTKNDFYKPLAKDKNGKFKIKSGETVRICMTSDFFLPEADKWREEVWNTIYQRPDVIFYILTKRAERIKSNLPYDWGDGWDNVSINVTCENQKRANERLPILLDIPAKHKGIMAAPLIGELRIREFLKSGQIEQVMCSGENYDGARVCDFDWIKTLQHDCVAENVKFTLLEIGNYFKKDGKIYNLKDKRLQSIMAYRSGMNFPGNEIHYNLKDNWGLPIKKDDLYIPYFGKYCKECGNRPICNGCSRCGKCDN